MARALLAVTAQDIETDFTCLGNRNFAWEPSSFEGELKESGVALIILNHEDVGEFASLGYRRHGGTFYDLYRGHSEYKSK